MENMTTIKTWRDFLPGFVYLYELDRADDLESISPKVLRDCVADNSLYPLQERIDDWWPDPTEYDMEQICKAMMKEGFANEYYFHVDEIRDYLWDNDKSDPMESLLSNTGDCIWFYSLGERFYDLWHDGKYHENEEDEDVELICTLLNIPADSPQAKIIRDIRCEATYGGELRIYFLDDLRNLITKNDDEDFTAIQFKGKFTVAIHNPNEGAGYFEDIDLDLKVVFNRENLFHATSDRFDIHETYGADHSDIAKGKPKLMRELPNDATEIKVSMHRGHMESEEQYERKFRAGGCSKGDMKFNRHRNIVYRNEYPCGHFCKDCGTFWID